MSATETNDPRLLRNALGAFATGVTIVTAHSELGYDVGLTANSFNSVSLDPPMVLWSLARSSPSLEVFEQASHFAVHVLAADQQALSDRFARRNEDKFAGVAFSRGRGNAPLFEECSARFECRLAFRYEGGDHVIFVGEVEGYAAVEKPPLIYHGGKYGLVVRRPAPPVLAPEPEEARRDLLTYLLYRASEQAFGPTREFHLAHDLTEQEHFALVILLRNPGCKPETLRQLLIASGRSPEAAPEAALIAGGMVEPLHDTGRRVLVLTEKGRALAITSLAAAQAVESRLVDGLDEGEALMLRQLLRRVIEVTSQGKVL